MSSVGRVDHRRVPAGWAAWFLVLAAALPPAATVRLGWVVLGGSVDASFGTQDPPLTGLALTANRWANLWQVQTLPGLLLTGLLPLVLLAGLVVTGRPRALVPTGSGRGAATVVATATAALGLASVAGFVALAAGLLPLTMWTGYTGSPLDAYAPDAAAVLTTAVVGVVTAALLWPREDDAEDDAGDGHLGGGAPLDEPAAVPQDEGAPVPVAPTPRGPTAPEGFPTVTDTDLYRRR